MPECMPSARINPRRFTIGNEVLVRAVTHFTRSNGARGRRIQRTEIAPRKGRVTGVAVRYEGTTDAIMGGGSWDEPAYPEGIEFIASSRHELWEVRFGVWNRPSLVADADVGVYEGKQSNLPVLYVESNYNWTDADKTALREEMENWPRDAKGHWIKKGKPNV